MRTPTRNPAFVGPNGMKMGELGVKMDAGDAGVLNMLEGWNVADGDGFCTWMVVIHDNLPLDSKMKQKPRNYCQSG